jgi:hypothetical protein
MEEYTPEPFAAPFPEDFDPREGVYEVVEREASGAVRLVSWSGRIRTVAPAQIAPGMDPRPQDRVLGILQGPRKAGFLA